MENRLYPLKFVPIYKTKIWGGNRFEKNFNRKDVPANCGESWEISGVEDNVSVVSDGFLKGNSLAELLEVYMGDLVGDAVYEKFGNEFPLLIKFIDACDDLSVQVHPNDELAEERHNSYGKTEMWYVLDTVENAKIINGFCRNVERSEYIENLHNGSLMKILNSINVHTGDIFFIPAGRVHAIGAGNLIAEIQQTSDVTYRIFDFDRRDSDGNLRELHTELAVDAIDYKYYDDYRTVYTPRINETVNAVDCKYFTTNVFEFSMPIEKDYPEIDSFVIYICTEGNCRIEYDENHSSVSLRRGETILIPAIIKNLCFYPEGKTSLLEVYIKS